MVSIPAGIKNIILREAKIFLIVAAVGVLAFITGVYHNTHTLPELVSSIISKLVGLSFCFVFFGYPLYIVGRVTMWFVMRQKK